MGLFGRDDRSESEPKEDATQVKSRRSVPGNQAVSTASVIASSTRIEGSILGSEDVRIDGQVAGTIDITSQLVIAEGGLVEGKVSARGIIVAGRVTGDLLAAERIELGPTCRVEGNITAPRILIHDGATFEGQVLMKKPSGWDARVQSSGITTSTARRPKSAEQRESKPQTSPEA